MIPLRVYVKGFLSYRDEAELTFDGAPLWVLSGPNGAGKSAIFDAITFALYGAHRGGKSNPEELKNHESGEMVVEFDFALGSDVYRVKRTLGGKRRTSFQVLHLSGPSAPRPGQPAPQPVTGTEKKDGLNKWVQEHLGLDYETFTASVLLRQGESEALLKAEPKDRHTMLTQIVNLSAYERLCQKAERQHKDFDARTNAFQSALQGLAPVDDREIEELATHAKQAQAELETTQKRLEELAGLKVHAKRWNELEQERSGIEEAVREARKTLLEVSRELQATDGEIAQTDVTSETLLTALNERIESMQERLDQLAELKIALPWMRQFDQARSDWLSAKTKVSHAETEQTKIAKQLTLISDKKAKAAERDQIKSAQAEQMQNALTEAKTFVKQAEDQLARFSQVAGKPACGYCGQPLKPEHLESERARLEVELQTAKSNSLRAEEDFKQAAAEQKAAHQQWQAINDEERQLQIAEQSAKRNLQQARGDQSKAEDQTRTILKELPQTYRDRIAPAHVSDIADCFGSEFPTTAELKDFSEQARQHQSVQRQLDKLYKQADAMEQQQQREDRLNQIKQEIEAIPSEARKPFVQLEAEERAARLRRQQCSDAMAEANSKKQELETRRERRRQLESERRDAAHRARLYKELARLLGRDNLQRYLLKQVEAAIVANANRILDHISGGVLRLKLRDDKDEDDSKSGSKSAVKALDLLAHNKQTSNAPLPVAFLSGSQRFRVAISLALGIGQFAGSASRGIESVIIDEGFGSLDKQGRHQVIEELQALKNVLSRIILVSHQEEFADAFPTRYVIGLKDGTSRASLFESLG